MNTPTSSKSRIPAFAVCVILLAVLMGVLFRKSFVPGQLAFSNDGPFGLMDAFSELRWSHFWRGAWVQANWIGLEVLPLQPSFTHGLFLAGGSVFFNKFMAPLSTLFFGICAYAFARGQRFAAGVGMLMGIAAMLNTNVFSNACWGLGGKATYLGFFLLAITAATGRGGPGLVSWLRLLLAGLCVGLMVIEGADGGAIQSIYFSAYLIFHEWVSHEKKGAAMFQGVGKLALVVVCSAWVAALSLSSLVGTQIQGVAGTAQDAQTKQKRWEFATGWSYPPAEVVRFAVPGIYGYRMDTPEGGNYWGSVGADGSPPRFSGGGEYAGVLVLVVAAWAVARAFSKKPGQPFDTRERKLIGFWAVTSFLSLLFAFGHYAPFYRLLYELPYFSTIRIPMKFLHPMHLGLIVLFGYGLEGMRRAYMEKKASGSDNVVDRLGAWWRSAAGFDRVWRTLLVLLPVTGLIVAFVYGQTESDLVRTLARTPGINAADAPNIAGFSIHEVWNAALFLAAYSAVLAIIASGNWGGRQRVAFIVLGVIFAVDMYRANIPWVQHYNYERRYQSNVVIDTLRTNAWEGRMTARLGPRSRIPLTNPNDGTFAAVHNQWLEHHFQSYRVQTVDIIQMARVPQLEEDFFKVLEPEAPMAQQLLAYGMMMDGLPADQAAQVRTMLDSAGVTNFFPHRRMWELTNTRYIVGARNAVDFLNNYFDPEKRRFRTKLDFALTLKSDTPQNRNPGLDDITAVEKPGGPYSIIEFTGALPRAKVFTRWESQTNGAAVLSKLADPKFDPFSEVILDDETAAKPAGDDPNATAEITQWLPRDVTIRTKSSQPGQLLVVQRWHPDWKATLDGQPVTLQRANYLFSAVSVPAGEHTVELHYQPKQNMLYVTLSALVAGAVALVLVGLLNRTPAAPEKK